ncbi:MAG: hypothetical protein WD009_07845 [Phycisphaeraceae bacterium]
MSQPDEQLVKRIADQVLAAMQGKAPATHAPAPSEASSSGAKPGIETPTPIRAPAGVCTGDYSKFTELMGIPIGARRREAIGSAAEEATPGAAKPSEIKNQQSATLDGIVTAQQLQTALDASADGVAHLAADAKLTPLAHDLARQHAERIVRAERARAKDATPAGAPSAASNDAAWLWWADGYCPNVQQLTTRLGGRLRASAAGRSDSGLVEFLQQLQRELTAGRVKGGVVFVRSAPQAVCYANQCAGVRAVWGHCLDTVREAVQQIGPNVLVLEYAYAGLGVMEQMMEAVLASPAQGPGVVQQHLRMLREGR